MYWLKRKAISVNGETIISLFSVCTVSIQRDMNGTMVMCKKDEVDNQLYSDFRSTFYFHNGH